MTAGILKYSPHAHLMQSYWQSNVVRTFNQGDLHQLSSQQSTSDQAQKLLHCIVCSKLLTNYADTALIVAGDFNQANCKKGCA